MSNVMGQKHGIVSLDSQILPNCGYVYIHEDRFSKGQALARAHHHFTIACDALYLPSLIIGLKDGNESNPEPLAKGMGS